MSDTTATPPPPAPEPPAPEAPKPAAPPEPDKGDKDWQAEAEKWKTFARKHEDTAKANADKAKRFDEFEESQKTEQQKLTDAATAAKAEADATKAELARVKAAVKHGLTEDDLDLLGSHGTPEEIDARAERLAARLKAAGDNKPKPDFGGGNRGTDVTASDSLDGQIAEATKAGNHQLAIALKQRRSALLAEKKS
jgi:hypothetical protein